MTRIALHDCGAGQTGPKSTGQVVRKGWSRKGIVSMNLAAFWSLAQGMPEPSLHDFRWYWFSQAHRDNLLYLKLTDEGPQLHLRSPFTADLP